MSGEYAIPDCGICGQAHKCHSPHLKSWCSICVPPITAASRNVIARFVADLPEPTSWIDELNEIDARCQKARYPLIRGA